MQSFADILSKHVKKTGLIKSIEAAMVVEFVNDWFVSEWGEEMKAEARAMSLRSNLLTIACLSSVAVNEIKLREDKLISAVNEKFGEFAVRQIKYML
ncbi:TPA: hypothetical protein DF272_06605 [Candidatus Falkowbacteria bacterium]|nr:hypothetical protein [Candidatus Falkowbacteria bacterium]